MDSIIEGREKARKIREQVLEEMKDIPRRNFDQNMFRAAYYYLRMHSLGKRGKGRAKEEIFKEAEKLVKKDHPEFVAGCKTGSDFHKKGLCRNII